MKIVPLPLTSFVTLLISFLVVTIVYVLTQVELNRVTRELEQYKQQEFDSRKD